MGAKVNPACLMAWDHPTPVQAHSLKSLVALRAPPGFPYLPFPLVLGEVHLFKDLRALLHHQRLLVGVC